MKYCTFDTALAKTYGVNEAIILNCLIFWVEHNKANRINFHDGYYWTHNTIDAWSEILHFMTKNQIRTAIESLIKQGAVITGNYNAKQYDRTLWYAVKPTVFAICENNKMDLRENPNAFVRKPTPIPVNNTVIEIYTADKEPEPIEPPLNSEMKSQVEQVMEKWNATVKLLPKILRTTKARTKHINARILEYGLATVLDVIDKVEASEFLSSRSNAWVNCNFDWVLKPDNFTKIVEGNYTKSAKPQQTAACGIGTRYKIVTGENGGNVEYADKSGLSPLEYYTGDADTDETS